MSVEARFYVTETTEFNGGQSGRVVLSAVSRGDQNAQWASATPCGKIELTINNLPAFEALRAIQRASKDVRVLISPVDVLLPGDGHPFRQAVNQDGVTDENYYTSQGKCGDCGYDAKAHSGKTYDQAYVDQYFKGVVPGK